MGAKDILIANADLRILGDYGRALGSEWNITSVTSSADAINKMAAQPYAVIVADAALPGICGADLLDRIHVEFPKTIRILLAHEADQALKIADVKRTHLILAKPCHNAVLKSAVERAVAINNWLPNDSLRELVGRLRTFPIVPSLYLQVVKALENPNTTAVEVGAIIARDMAMMTKLLQVTNSACFGLSRKISDPVEVVGLLGFETVKTMVMTLQLLSQYDKVKPVYFSIDRLWRHSTEVAQIARHIVRTQTDDSILADSAFTAGLMHDLGKLILAANFDEHYSGAQELARKQQIPLADVEKQIFGASHGELGAYLLGLWGMPLGLVEAAALHHHPSRSLARHLTPLTAVHLADALYYEVRPDKQGFIPPKIDEAYLAELGLSDALQSWRETVVNQESDEAEFRIRASQTRVSKKTAAADSKPSPRAAKSKSASSPSAPRGPSALNQWLGPGLAAAVCLLMLCFGGPALVRRALGPSLEPERQTDTTRVVPPVVVTEPVQPAPPALPVEKPAEKPVPVPVLVAATNPAPVVAPPTELPAFADLQLQSIFFSQTNPSAVINGQTVHPQDRLPAGAIIVVIGPSSVTLEFNNARKTLALD